MGTGRFPDFLLIGFKKCGTTSVARWLSEHPEAFVTEPKEPHFFDIDENWRNGADAYQRLFTNAPPDAVAGEASTGYTHPDSAERSAERIHRTIPDVKLVCVLRDPVERLRSHYRHRRLNRGESRSLVEALRSPDSIYVRQSMYHACLTPYIDTFEREQLCIASIEEVREPAGQAWRELTDHLGLAPLEHSGISSNRSEDQGVDPAFWPAVRRRFEPVLAKTPPRIRRSGRMALARLTTKKWNEIDTDSLAPIPGDVVERLHADAERLWRWLGHDAGLWPVR